MVRSTNSRNVFLDLAPGLQGVMPLAEGDITDASDYNLWRPGDKIDVEAFEARACPLPGWIEMLRQLIFATP